MNFDYLFGYQSGVRNILVSALLGGVVVGMLYPDITSQDANKFVLMAVGYPIWLVIRKLYWNHRFDQFVDRLQDVDCLFTDEQVGPLVEYNPGLYEMLEIMHEHETNYHYLYTTKKVE